jgi:hypothetical protein
MDQFNEVLFNFFQNVWMNHIFSQKIPIFWWIVLYFTKILK